MCIGPMGAATGVTGTPLTQTTGSEVERAQGQVGAQGRQVYYGRRAEAAAGVGQVDGEDHEADRTAPTAGAPGKSRRPTRRPILPKTHPAAPIPRGNVEIC